MSVAKHFKTHTEEDDAAQAEKICDARLQECGYWTQGMWDVLTLREKEEPGN